MHADERLSQTAESQNNDVEQEPLKGTETTYLASLGLMRIIHRNKQRLAQFKNRIRQADFIDKPNMRLVGTARSHAQTLNDQIESLEGELLDISRQESGGVVLKAPQEPDLRWIWWWLNEPSVQALLPAVFPALDDFTDQYEAWCRTEGQHPLAVYLATGDLIGFALMSHQDRMAALDLIILRPDYRNQGYGTDAVTAAMQMVFEQLDAEIFAIEVDLNHGPALRCFEKCGLKSLLKETEESIQTEEQGAYLLGMHQDDWFRRQDQAETTRTVWSTDQQMKITLGDFGDLGRGE